MGDRRRVAGSPRAASAIGSVAAARAFGRMTVASAGRSTSSPSDP